MDLFDPGAEDDRDFVELNRPVKPAEEGESPPVAIISIIGAIILIVLLVLLGRFIYHKVNSPSAENTSGTGQVTVQTPLRVNKQPSSRNSSGSSSSSNSSSGSSSSSSSSSSNNGASSISSTGKLPNNGPGDVIGIFVSTTFAAAGLHYIVTLRRSNRVKIGG